MGRILVSLLMACAVIAGQQPQSARQSSDGSTGTLVLRSGAAGNVQIDGKDAAKTSTDQILQFKLGPGQHFVTLRDLNGTKLGEKIVSITVGATTAETLAVAPPLPQLHTGVAPAATEVQPKKQEQLSVSLTATQRAGLLAGIGRYQEAIDIYTSLGDARRQRISQVGLDKLSALYGSPTSGQTGSAILLYSRGHHREAMRQIELGIEEHLSRMKSGRNSMGVSNLAHCYEKRALIEFALGDYAGALQDAEAVQDRLAEARALDKERFKEIGEQTERLFIDLMAIHLLQGNRSAGCALFNEKPLANMNEVPFPVQEICASAPQAQSERRSPGSEIDDVVRNGRYSRLPPPKMLAGGAGFGPSHISLVNKTRYTLTVIFSGPAESTASVQAGQAVKLDLIPGVYRVLGRVDDSPTVLPLLGSHEYSAGTEYESAFSIAP